ncbi:MAG: 16S rRNA (guanine(527)-N(7))-methyltransferase RsmG [Porphyromonas sp.]|nr:16S rRNA (guanine(527)-N(7))-methyltransferase RsmG [Porphyromonas sp.]
MIVEKYFPDLSLEQQTRFLQLGELYREWNSRINVISRKDIDELYCHHVLHSLGITQMLKFKPGTKVIDLGTGGGFPGIPLAILFPEVDFLLVDSIGKKIKVVTAVALELGLQNVRATQCRAEQLVDEKCHFVVSRAAMALSDLVKAARPLVDRSEQFNALPNGLLCLKGGDLTSELHSFRSIAMADELYPYFEEEFFKNKKVVYLPL